MQKAVKFRQLAEPVALMTVTAGGALAIAACTPTVPTATLDAGTVTVTGTAASDRLAVTIGTSELTVDFGSDGTVDARFARSQVQRVRVWRVTATARGACRAAASATCRSPSTGASAATPPERRRQHRRHGRR